MTSNDYMATLPAAGPPFLPRTYGFDLPTLPMDFMHADFLGVGDWLLANALIGMANVGRFVESLLVTRSRDWSNLSQLHTGCL